MICQRKTASVTTASGTTDFQLNHNPNANKVYIYISQTGGTQSVKTISGRLHPDAGFVSLATPTVGSDTYTEVDICSEYRITLQNSSGSGTATIVVVN